MHELISYVIPIWYTYLSERNSASCQGEALLRAPLFGHYSVAKKLLFVMWISREEPFMGERRRVRGLSNDYNIIVSLKIIIVTITKHYWDCRGNIRNYFHA